MNGNINEFSSCYGIAGVFVTNLHNDVLYTLHSPSLALTLVVYTKFQEQIDIRRERKQGSKLV